MTVAELIDALKALPQDLNVMAAGETAQKVIVEECEGNKYVRIFEPWDVEFSGRDIDVPTNEVVSLEFSEDIDKPGRYKTSDGEWHEGMWSSDPADLERFLGVSDKITEIKKRIQYENANNIAKNIKQFVVPDDDYFRGMERALQIIDEVMGCGND